VVRLGPGVLKRAGLATSGISVGEDVEEWSANDDRYATMNHVVEPLLNSSGMAMPDQIRITLRTNVWRAASIAPCLHCGPHCLCCISCYPGPHFAASESSSKSAGEARQSTICLLGLESGRLHCCWTYQAALHHWPFRMTMYHALCRLANLHLQDSLWHFVSVTVRSCTPTTTGRFPACENPPVAFRSHVVAAR
jgi:hypothetical protein